ncbi:MAG: hypothetical protein A2Y33_00035 [Spirochaetes bacterium GWF1_51_8]|nr:MAG: hypothetical protein A2Y33_00035 [Spirochaetes bacterium GWF1_51_8]
MIKSAFIFLLTFSVCLPLFANDLSLTGKNIVFYMDSLSGHYYIENPSPSVQDLKDLLFKDNPPTSYATIIYNSKPYRLNDGMLNVIENFHIEGNKIIGVYGIDQVEFRIMMYITNSAAKEENDSVIFLVTAKNNGTEESDVGARFLFDTVYNERWGKPELYLASSEKIQYERLLVEASIPEYIFSGIYNPEKMDGMYIYPYLNNLRPEKVIVGNWKKLDENELDYSVDPQGKFKYNDFANKDAAVAVFYSKIYLKPGETVNFGCLLTRKVFTYDVLSSQLTSIQSVIPVALSNTNVAAVSNTNTIAVIPVTNIALPVTNKIAVAPKTNNLDVVCPPDESDMIASAEVDGKTPSVMTSGVDMELLKAQLALLEKLTTLIEKMDNQLTMTQTVKPFVTNVIQPPADNKKVEETKQAYEAELQKQKLAYDKLLADHQKNIQELIDTYEKRLMDESSYKVQSYTLKELDKSLAELDNQITLVEELSKMNLDFKTMPKEQLDQLKKQVEKMENKLLKLKIK